MRVMDFPNNSGKHFIFLNNETRLLGYVWIGPSFLFRA